MSAFQTAHTLPPPSPSLVRWVCDASYILKTGYDHKQNIRIQACCSGFCEAKYTRCSDATAETASSSPAGGGAADAGFPTATPSVPAMNPTPATQSMQPPHSSQPTPATLPKPATQPAQLAQPTEGAPATPGTLAKQPTQSAHHGSGANSVGAPTPSPEAFPSGPTSLPPSVEVVVDPYDVPSLHPAGQFALSPEASVVSAGDGIYNDDKYGDDGGGGDADDDDSDDDDDGEDIGDGSHGGHGDEDGGDYSDDDDDDDDDDASDGSHGNHDDEDDGGYSDDDDDDYDDDDEDDDDFEGLAGINGGSKGDEVTRGTNINTSTSGGGSSSSSSTGASSSGGNGGGGVGDGGDGCVSEYPVGTMETMTTADARIEAVAIDSQVGLLRYVLALNALRNMGLVRTFVGEAGSSSRMDS